MKTNSQFRTLCCSKSPILLSVVLMCIISVSCSISPEKRPSPLKIDSLKIGDNVLRIEYSSPSVRGRKIFGEGDNYLVNYSKMWRTGANEATILSTEKDISMDTLNLPAGKYALFTIPNEDSWEIIINKEWDQWGVQDHKDSLDAVRLFVPILQLDSIVEQMDFTFDQKGLNFKWENVSWSILISSNE